MYFMMLELSMLENSLALVGPPGPYGPGPLWASLGPCGSGSCGLPWGLLGWALVGNPWP